MEIKISQKTEQPLLSRTELQGIISFDSVTPSRAEVRKKISEAVKADESLIMVTSIDTSFGEKSAKIKANIYKTKEDAEKYESKSILQRHAPKKKEATEGEAPAAPAEKPKAGAK